jgi:hypothetical protein
MVSDIQQQTTQVITWELVKTILCLH